VRPALAVLAAALAAAACATPPSPLERAARAPVPILAETSAGAPEVLRKGAAAEAARLLEDARARGSIGVAEVVAAALATREDLLRGDESRLQATLEADLALASLLPEVRMKIRHDRQDPIDAGPGGGRDEPARTLWNFQVVQPIFQGFREIHARRAAERTAEALGEDLEVLRRGLALSVARAFFLAVESAAEVRALEETLRVDEERVREMAARAAGGLARRTEVLLQESRRETTRAAVLQARERRDAAVLLLESLAGFRIGVPLDPGADLPGPVPAAAEAVAEALRRRPEPRAAERRWAAALEEARVAAGERWPLVTAEANWYARRWNDAPSAEETHWDAGFFLDLPLFLGGAIDARERLAASRLRQALLDRSSALRSIAREVEAALVRLRAGLERLETLRANERSARENLDLLQEEYRQGLARNLEVFTAQVQLQDAVVGLERQIYQSRLDRIELRWSMGDAGGLLPAHPSPPAGPPAAAPEKP
jgi:outer membrane protein